VSQVLPSSTQMVLRDGFIEFSFGQPDPGLLPVDALRRAAADALDRYGPTMLAYGAPEGAWPLLGWIRDRVERVEGVSLALDECLGTGGNSDGIDQVCTLFTEPDDIVLVESPTYHLGLKVLRDHHLDLRPIPMDEGGLRVDALESTLAAVARDGHRVRMLYTIPTFHNPTGVNLADDRRRAVVDVAVRHGFLILEDDVYRELAYDVEAPPSLFALAPRGTVLRLGSFAKSLAPGVRLGWMNGRSDQIKRVWDGGLRDSGGAANYAMGMIVSALCASGEYDRHVARLRAAYHERRDALVQALESHLPEGCAFDVPGGGYFIWVRVPESIDTTVLAATAERHGVSFVPGARLCPDGRGTHHLRLAFSLVAPHQMDEGIRRLAAAIRDHL
jgi:DNA-binding transcriptional MocR family regulator